MNNKQSRGYTLPELLVVIAIIGIIVAIAIASASMGKALARDNQRTSDIRLLQLKLEAYRDIYGVYPATLDGLVNSPTQLSQKIIPAIPVPPQAGAASGETQYLYTAIKIAGDSANTCVGYHLGITLEGNRTILQRRAGKPAYSSTLTCSGSTNDTINASVAGSKVYDVVSPDMEHN